MREPDLTISRNGNPTVDYILWLRRKLREANENAMEASAEWVMESERADKACAEKGYNYWQRREHRRSNPYMSDAMDRWSWWEREAKRIASQIEGELRILGLLEKLRDQGEISFVLEQEPTASPEPKDPWWADMERLT